MESENKNSSLLSRWKNKEGKTLDTTSIPKAPENSVIPLSSGQQRIWFLQQLYPKNPFYNYSESLSFEGELNVNYLKQSLHQVLLNNEILRSYYPIVNGRPILKVSDDMPDVKEFDFGKLTEDAAAKEIDQLMREQSATLFDLASPSLLKISLFKQDAKRHILFFTMHHVIIDEWSISLLKDQLANNYARLTQGLNLEVKKAGIEFSDYAYWQRNEGIDSGQLDYWKDKLAGEIPILNLQTDFSRPIQPLFRGKQFTQELSPQLSSDILGLTKKMETTPFVFLLSVYYVLLQRYSGQNDILVGTPISNRSARSLENLFGFFIDTVVLRNKLDTSLSFSEFVQKIKKNTFEAFSNKDVPFDTLVKELKVERSLSINPFFQVMFLYHPESEKPSFGNDVRLTEQSEFDTEVAKFDLTLSISESNGLLSLTFEYDTDLFEESTIAGLLEHYKILLQGIFLNPNLTIAEIPMLTKREEEIFLEEFVPANDHFSAYTGIHHIIEDVCQNLGDKTALTFKDNSITYRDLEKKAELLAKHILEKTKKRNEIVGLCMGRSLDMIVGMFAVLKAGCAYLPIDPNYPVERLDFILKDAECGVIVTENSLTKLFENSGKELLTTDQIELLDVSSVTELPIVREDDIAYVIYTSGSTGQPKGVPITHKNIINSTAGRLAFYPKNPDAFLLMSSISFDSSKAGIFWTLCTGGNLVITESRIEQDISKIEDLINEHSISHTLMLPSLYKLLLEHAAVSRIDCLSTVMVAGEACPASLCDMHFEKLPKVKLYNEYGPTEATVWCIAHTIEKSDGAKGVPIGKAVANAKVYLLNENLNLVPFGAVGEIYIGGPGLATAYINKPQLTEKAFIINSFGNGPSEKLYKTGDLGRYRKDGAIEFLGRLDHQVKIRGFRIELDEIEKVILDDSSVTDVVAMVEESRDSVDFIEIHDFSDSVELTKLLKQYLSDIELNELLSSERL